LCVAPFGGVYCVTLLTPSAMPLSQQRQQAVGLPRRVRLAAPSLVFRVRGCGGGPPPTPSPSPSPCKQASERPSELIAVTLHSCHREVSGTGKISSEVTYLALLSIFARLRDKSWQKFNHIYWQCVHFITVTFDATAMNISNYLCDDEQLLSPNPPRVHPFLQDFANKFFIVVHWSRVDVSVADL